MKSRSRLSNAGILTILGLFITCFFPFTAYPQETSGVKCEESSCLQCHADHVFTKDFPNSVHAANGCTSCHTGIDLNNIYAHMSGETKPKLVSCGKCHKEIWEKYKKDYHYLYQDFRCYDCHRNIHQIKKQNGNFKIAVITQCTQCHTNDEYVKSGHGKAVLEGNKDAPTCTDCHGLHNVKVYHTSEFKHPEEARHFYDRTCMRCHSNEEMMKRHGLTAKTVEFYLDTYHGQVADLGYPSLVAGCVDCHTSHNILPPNDPHSSVNPANLVKTCGKCHPKYNIRMISYQSHPDVNDHTRFPILYWSHKFMGLLLLGTFLFFWVHTLLWWRKTYWEKHEKEKIGIVPKRLIKGSEGLQPIRRFTWKEIILHIALILSFFTVVLTGFPLKFHDMEWAKVLIRFWGGAHRAGIYHRIAGIVMWIEFLYVAIRSLRFLFPKGQTKGWLKRLFGPDSLFPNLKDLQDLRDMFKWFFNKGEEPKFDRWSYWEKFDFLAVFWGMSVIGITGLVLMKPEWSSYILPGWAFDVALDMHGEEAILAALFIFTVHFFNTHLIPKKFPMDRVIFTGRYTLEELKELRPKEYERLLAEGKIEEIKSKHPSILSKLLAAAFGLTSLLLGIFLAGLIIWSIIVHM